MALITTGDASSGTIAPPVVLAATNPDDVALTIYAVPGDPGLHYVFRVYDRDGNLKVDIDNSGVFDAASIAVQDPPDTGTPGGGIVALTPGKVRVIPPTGSLALDVDSIPDGQVAVQVRDTSSNTLFTVSSATYGHVVQFGATTATDVPLQMNAGPLATADSIELWDYPFNNKMFAVGPTGYVDLLEQADPAAPDADKARLFSRDNGAGKTELCVKFATGAVQVIATQP